MGNENQLPPVGRGGVFINLIKWGKYHGNILELTQIHRQIETNPIYKIGQHICKGINPENILDYVDGYIVQFYTPSSYQDAISMAVKLKQMCSRTPFDTQIITPWTNVASSINSKMNLGRVGFKLGDFVMCTTNIPTADFDKFRVRQRISFPIHEGEFLREHIYKSNKVFDKDEHGNFITDTIQRFTRALNGSCGI